MAMKVAAVIVVAFAMASCWCPRDVTAIQCLDDAGTAVDWWFITTLKKQLGGGMVMSTSRATKPRYLDISINHCSGPLKKTLDVAFNDATGAARAGFGHLMYSDYNLGDGDRRGHAHARGLVAWQFDTANNRLDTAHKAIWITSSCPSFPAKKWSNMFGGNCFALVQTAHCITFNPFTDQPANSITWWDKATRAQADINYYFKNYLNSLMFHLSVRKVWVTSVGGNQLAAIVARLGFPATGVMGYLYHMAVGADVVHNTAVERDMGAAAAPAIAAAKLVVTGAVTNMMGMRQNLLTTGAGLDTTFTMYSKAHGVVVGLWDDIVFAQHAIAADSSWKITTFLSGQRKNPAACCIGAKGAGAADPTRNRQWSNSVGGCGSGCSPWRYQLLADALRGWLDIRALGTANNGLCRPADRTDDPLQVGLEDLINKAIASGGDITAFAAQLDSWCLQVIPVNDKRTIFYDLLKRLFPIIDVHAAALATAGCAAAPPIGATLGTYLTRIMTLLNRVNTNDQALFNTALDAICAPVVLDAPTRAAAWGAAITAVQASPLTCQKKVEAVQQWTLPPVLINNLPGDGPARKGWKASSCDHSKLAWEAATAADPTVVCVGDVNRHGGQKKIGGGNNVRGGGAMCWPDAKVDAAGALSAGGTRRLIAALNAATEDASYECKDGKVTTSDADAFAIYGHGTSLNDSNAFPARPREQWQPLRGSRSWSTASLVGGPLDGDQSRDGGGGGGREWSTMARTRSTARAERLLADEKAAEAPQPDPTVHDIAPDNPEGDDPCAPCRLSDADDTKSELCCECCAEWGFIENRR